MWVVTKYGFFSIVRKPWDAEHDTLTVRARVRGDLERFKAFCPSLGRIEEDDKADYKYRAQACRRDVAATLEEMVDQVDYDNFKAEIAPKDPKREALYSRVWLLLRELQEVPWRNKS